MKIHDRPCKGYIFFVCRGELWGLKSLYGNRSLEFVIIYTRVLTLGANGNCLSALGHTYECKNNSKSREKDADCKSKYFNDFFYCSQTCCFGVFGFSGTVLLAVFPFWADQSSPTFLPPSCIALHRRIITLTDAVMCTTTTHKFSVSPSL